MKECGIESACPQWGDALNAYEQAGAFADRIESELRAANAWRDEALPETAYDSEQAFFADTMTFYQWLQFVLLPRVRTIIEERGGFPAESSVGAYAIRELDGNDEAAGLITALCEFDSFIDDLHGTRE
jgi:uncharacterized protein YqcC (DUF446 family)